jgi:hypothetical protein
LSSYTLKILPTLTPLIPLTRLHPQPSQALQKAKLDKEAEVAATKAKWQQLLDEATRAHSQEKEANAALQQQLAQVSYCAPGAGVCVVCLSPSTSLVVLNAWPAAALLNCLRAIVGASACVPVQPTPGV